ncbi:MAG: hypothetical protein PUF50_06815 [Erysipelotrichaceae bacterium]|nr:hypothetical protein [Erysipelotrichaceae bacterium]
MEPIGSFFEVIEKLKEYEIVATIQDKTPTFFRYRNQKVYAKQTNTQFVLSLDEFIQLYQKEEFYLYQPKQEETISLEKDEEYYRWKHK